VVQTIGKHQKSPLSYTRIFYLVIGIISVRVICEWLLLDFPIQLNIFQDYARFYLENIYYFLIVFLVGSVLISEITKISLVKVMDFGVKLYPLIVLPPLIDSILFGRVEGYYYGTIDNFLGNILSLTFLTDDASPGIFILILVGLLSVFLYVYRKTKKFWKGVLVFLLMDLLLMIISTPDLFFGGGKGDYCQNYFLPAYYFLPFLIFLSAALAIYNKNKLLLILKNIRPVRLLVFILSVVLGGVFGYSSNNYLNIPNFIWGIFAIFFMWEVSVIINDIHDIEIDKVMNKTRPLITGGISINEYKLLAYLLSFLSLSFAVVISVRALLLIILFLFLAVSYSSPPLRLRKNFLGNFVIGVSLTISFLMGVYSSGMSAIILTNNIVCLAFLIGIFGTIITVAKDIKDIEGDKKAKVKNLFTLYGKKRGKAIVIALIFLTLNIPALVLGIWTIFLLSLIACYFYYRFESIKAVYTVSVIIVFITAFILVVNVHKIIVFSPKINYFLVKNAVSEDFRYNYILFLDKKNDILSQDRAQVTNWFMS